MLNVHSDILNAGLSAPEFAVLLQIAKRVNSSKTCWPGKDLLKKETKLGRKALAAAIAGLKERKLISASQTHENGGFSKIVYTLLSKGVTQYTKEKKTTPCDTLLCSTPKCSTQKCVTPKCSTPECNTPNDTLSIIHKELLKNLEVLKKENTEKKQSQIAGLKKISDQQQEILKLKKQLSLLQQHNEQLEQRLNEQANNKKPQQKLNLQKHPLNTFKNKKAAQHTTQPPKMQPQPQKGAKNEFNECMKVYQEFYNSMQQAETPAADKYLLRFNRFPKERANLANLMKFLTAEYRENNPGATMPTGQQFAEQVFKPFFDLFYKMSGNRKKYWFTKNYLPSAIHSGIATTIAEMQKLKNSGNETTISINQSQNNRFSTAPKTRNLTKLDKARAIIRENAKKRYLEKMRGQSDQNSNGAAFI